MQVDRMTVFGDIGLILACLILSAVLMATVTFFLLREFSFNHRQIGWFAVFLRDGKLEKFFLVAIVCRLFLSFALLFDDNFLSLPLLTYLLLSLILWVIGRNFRYIVFDFLYVAEISAGFYLLLLLREETQSAQVQPGMKLLLWLAVLFFFAMELAQFLCALPEFFHAKMHNREEQSMTEDDRIVAKRTKLLLLLPLVFSLFPVMMFLQVTSVNMTTAAYQLVDGNLVAYEAGGRIREGEGSCFLVQGKKTTELKQTPLFFEGEETIVFPSVYSVVQPALQLSNRVRALSVLRRENGEYYSIAYDGKTVEIEDFFLFDGKDTYLFPAGTELKWEEEVYRVTEVCQVIAKYNQYIAIYDTRTEEYRTIPLETGFCTAELPDRSRVNLSTDIMYRENGQEQMLFMQPSLLSDLQ